MSHFGWDHYKIMYMLRSLVYGARLRIYCVLCSKHMAPLAVCSAPLLVRDQALGVPEFFRLAYSLTIWWGHGINSSPPSDAYMRQWIRSALVQITVCRLLGAKPLSKPMQDYCQLDPWEQTSVKFLSKYQTVHSLKCICKYHLRNGDHFVHGEMS